MTRRAASILSGALWHLATVQIPPEKKAKKLSQKEQSERFKQTARELEADESGASFEKAVGKPQNRVSAQ